MIDDGPRDTKIDRVGTRGDRAGSAPAVDRGSRFVMFTRLIRLLEPHRWRLAIALTALIGASCVSLAYPILIGRAIDATLGARSTADLDLVAIALVGVFVVSGAFVWLRQYSLVWLGERAIADLRMQVFDRMLTLPLAWFHDRRSGELSSRLTSDVAAIEVSIVGDLPVTLRSGVVALGATPLLLSIDVTLTLIMLAVVPVIVVATTRLGRRLRPLAGAVQDELANVGAQAQESIAGIATVQSFVRETHESHRYRRGIERSFASIAALVRQQATFQAVAMTSGYLGMTAVLWLGGRAMIDGRLSSGDLTSFFLYTALVAAALADLVTTWGSIQRAAGASARVFELIETVPEIRDVPGAIALPAGKGELRFDAVSFAYERRAPVLEDVDFVISPGEVVGLVGPSGAGKSTIVSLLLRFYEARVGRVLLEGVDVRQLRLADLRRAFACVSQEPTLFSGTIRDNIAYGRDAASDESIRAAAIDAHAHDFISSFPDGYDTVVGERGAKLSTGQKQRIAIARALLADPRVLILDEATSNLDAHTEAAVHAALARLMAGRTSIIIAHRLSAVRRADRILVLEGSRIVEQGRHDDLMSQRGTYYRLAAHQLAAS